MDTAKVLVQVFIELKAFVYANQWICHERGVITDVFIAIAKRCMECINVDCVAEYFSCPAHGIGRYVKE